MTQRAIGRGLLAAATLLILLASPNARAADSVGFKFVLDIQLGTSVTEGVVPVIGNFFTIREVTWFRRVDLSGALNGSRVKVSGDWDGNYMRGECEIIDGQCQLTFETTGVIYSAFLSLTVH
jgi:hypothetical protein